MRRPSAAPAQLELIWPGKSEARAAADSPLTMTFTGTGLPIQLDANYLIAADNLDALKFMLPTYATRIHTIYIDPPYNSGNSNFIYPDDFTQRPQVPTGADGAALHRAFTLHAEWLNMMYPRLVLARRLLRRHGLLFVSIDERELFHLKIILDEIFGPENFVELFSWAKTETPANLSRQSKKVLEYVLCYQNGKDRQKFKGIRKQSPSTNGLLNQTNRVQSLCFPAGCVQTRLPDGPIPAGTYGTKRYVIELLDDAEVRDGKFITPVPLRAKFKWTQAKLKRELAAGTEVFIVTKTLSPSYEKTAYAPEVPPNLINHRVGVVTNEEAGKQLQTLLGDRLFSFPKPVSLVRYLLGFRDDPAGIYLDFFAGSGTLAEAVAAMNAEDGETRRFVCVQNPEPCPVDSRARKRGLGTVADLCRYRLERVRDEYAATKGAFQFHHLYAAPL